MSVLGVYNQTVFEPLLRGLTCENGMRAPAFRLLWGGCVCVMGDKYHHALLS